MNTKYFYIRQPNPKNPTHRGDPIACIAYERHNDPDVENSDYVIYAFSIANPKDEFRKDRARDIADARLNDTHRTLPGFVVHRDCKTNDLLRGLVAFFVDSDGVPFIRGKVKGLPKRVLNAAEAWLEKGK